MNEHTEKLDFLEVPYQKPDLGEEEIAEVVACLKSGWLTTGPRTTEFEESFASYVGAEHAVAVNSCTAALHLALKAVGVSPGDAVVVPTMTFAATAEVVLHCGAKPLFVDCRESDLNMDMDFARKVIVAAREAGTRVSAIIPMHYGGQIGDVEATRALAQEFGLAIVGDAAHCCPAYYRKETNAPWQSVSSDADISCFSFYANKSITTGEGGMLVTNNAEWARDAKIRRLHGIDMDAWDRHSGNRTSYTVAKLGYKYNLTDIASAIGIHQLRKADNFLQGRRRVAEFYAELLGDLEGVVLPTENPNRVHSWHIYPIRILPRKGRPSRGEVQEKLRERGIFTSIHWKPLHLHRYYVEEFGLKSASYPEATRLFDQLVSLPIYHLLSDAQVEYVSATLKNLLRGTG